ncbi:MAG: hypothetical protein RJA57_1216 [Bacteroidota bacterium]
MLLLILPTWGFFAHQRINEYAVYLLPPELIAFYKPHIGFLSEHATDPDKRRYALPEEGARHYIDLDRYGSYPFPSLPRRWEDAIEKFSADTVESRGTVPWWIQVQLGRLTKAFRDKDPGRALRISAELGHYIADAHVPLHACHNHDGQYTGQRGIHGFWESRLPELLADKEWDFLIGKAAFISDPAAFIWDRILESAAAADTVLRIEKHLTERTPPGGKYAFEERNGVLTRQYASGLSRTYDRLLNGMVERRMRESVWAVASFWYTAWIRAGQPGLQPLNGPLSEQDRAEMESLNEAWRRTGGSTREHRN